MTMYINYISIKIKDFEINNRPKKKLKGDYFRDLVIYSVYSN